MMCAQSQCVRESLVCGVSVYTPRRLQWIAGVILLGGSDHMEVEQDRGEEIGQDVETPERGEEVNGRRDNAQSDTW